MPKNTITKSSIIHVALAGAAVPVLLLEPTRTKVSVSMEPSIYTIYDDSDLHLKVLSRVDMYVEYTVPGVDAKTLDNAFDSELGRPFEAKVAEIIYTLCLQAVATRLKMTPEAVVKQYGEVVAKKRFLNHVRDDGMYASLRNGGLRVEASFFSWNEEKPTKLEAAFFAALFPEAVNKIAANNQRKIDGAKAKVSNKELKLTQENNKLLKEMARMTARIDALTDALVKAKGTKPKK